MNPDRGIRERGQSGSGGWLESACKLIVAILPWDSAELGKSPFAAALDEIGIPAAAQVMNVVVLTAVLAWVAFKENADRPDSRGVGVELVPVDVSVAGPRPHRVGERRWCGGISHGMPPRIGRRREGSPCLVWSRSSGQR